MAEEAAGGPAVKGAAPDGAAAKGAAVAGLPSAPGPRSLKPLGLLREVRDQPLRLFLECAERYGDVTRLRFATVTAHVIRGPANIQHVLQTHSRNYGKQTRGFQKLRLVLGQGLLTSEGDFWLRQRRIAQPAFHRTRIAGFAGEMVRAAEESGARLAEAARSGAVVDVAAEMMRLALQIVSRTLFSSDVSDDADRIGGALNTLLRQANDRMRSAFDVPLSIPTPANLRFLRARRTLDTLVLQLIAERRKAGGDAPDLLGMLMSARDEATGEAMTDRQLRDEAMTILLAGHETTAVALSWTWMLLSQHPAEARALHAELAEVLAGRAPSLADLPRLPRTLAVIEESMRLYPPAWIIGRSVVEDDALSGYRIPGGSIVLLSTYAAHRDPRIFENPEAFDPERFLRRPESQLPRFAYFPFGGGPRICIGNAFALMEAQLVLACLAQRFRLDLVPGHPVDPEPSITLRPRHGMRMTVHAR
jgi:cytochrome P450